MKMRKVFFVAVLIVLALSVGAFAFQNEPEGFRGFKWGDPPTEEMEFLIDIGSGTTAYILPGDKMFLGSVPLYLVAYMFYENRFKSAAMYFKGEDNYDLLETICKERYGKEEADIGFYKIKWQGQRTSILLNYDYVEEKGTLSLSSYLIAMEGMKAKEKEEAGKAAGDW